MNREPMNGSEQNRSMKNDKQDKKNCERNPNATSPFSSRGGIFLLIIFHEHFTLWTGRERARGSAVKGHASACPGTRSEQRWHQSASRRHATRQIRTPPVSPALPK